MRLLSGFFVPAFCVLRRVALAFFVVGFLVRALFRVGFVRPWFVGPGFFVFAPAVLRFGVLHLFARGRPARFRRGAAFGRGPRMRAGPVASWGVRLLALQCIGSVAVAVGFSG